MSAWLQVNGDLLLVLSGDPRDTTILLVGPGFARDLGWDAHALQGHSWETWAHPDDIPLARDAFQNARPGPVQHVICRWQHKTPAQDGTPRWVWLEWAILCTLTPYRIYTHARDLTNRFEREAQVSTWSRVTSDLMAVFDTAIPIETRKFEWVNEAWTRQLGWPLPAIYDSPITQLLYPTTETEQCLQAVCMGNTGRPSICQVQSQEGTFWTYEWTGTQLNGKVYIVGRNVDSMLRQQAELRTAIRDLEIRNADLEKFASVAAHQLRSPPRTIAGIAQALREDYGSRLDQAGLQFLADIREDADQMAEIVDGLYRFSKVRTAEDLVVEDVNLEHLLADISASKIRRGILQFPDKVTWDFLPTVRAPKVLLHEVFVNLISNGLKFNESAAKIIRISAQSRTDGRWDIHVTDNGIGIDPKYHGKLFIMFQRIHPKYKGTGVGLALVAAIVQKLGGQVSVLSQPNQGTTITLDLPNAGSANGQKPTSRLKAFQDKAQEVHELAP